MVRISCHPTWQEGMSSLRRLPQKVAASLDPGGAHNPHAKRGDRRGALAGRAHEKEREAPAPPMPSRVFGMAEDTQLNRAPGMGTAHKNPPPDKREGERLSRQ